jgi:hypothetical protein
MMASTWLREPFALPNGVTGGNMRRAIVVALGTGAFISSAAALSLGITEDSRDMSRSAYEQSLRRIEAARAAVFAKCDAAAAAERELCRTAAQANEMVRVAEVEHGYRRTEQSARALQRARIDARYQIDRARCGVLAGYKRDRCLVQAHATRGRAMLAAAGPYEARL